MNDVEIKAFTRKMILHALTYKGDFSDEALKNSHVIFTLKEIIFIRQTKI